MSKFDPAGAWSLREAVMHTADRSRLAQLHRDMIEAYAAGISFKQPVWWIYRLAPPPAPARVPPLPVEHLFVYDREGGVPLCLISELGCNRLELMLAAGELRCWGRPGAPHAAHAEVPWASVQIADWTHGQLVAVTLESVDGLERSVPVSGGLRYYDARIEKPDGALPKRDNAGPGRPVEPYKQALMKSTAAWLAQQQKVPRLTRVREFVENAAWNLGENPSDGTTKNYAREALEAEIRRRQRGQKRQ